VEESAVTTLLLRARAQRAEQSQLQSGSAGVVAVAVQVVRSHSHLLVQFLPQDLNPMELPRSRSAAVEVPVGTTLLLAEQEQALVAERSQSDSAALAESQVTVDLSSQAHRVGSSQHQDPTRLAYLRRVLVAEAATVDTTSWSQALAQVLAAQVWRSVLEEMVAAAATVEKFA